MNDVTLFSNGIGHFRRTYKVPANQEETITIPFKTDYIGDVAASLQVFGKVRLAEPPSFTPKYALRKPGMAPHNAPPRKPNTIAPIPAAIPIIRNIVAAKS